MSYRCELCELVSGSRVAIEFIILINRYPGHDRCVCICILYIYTIHINTLKSVIVAIADEADTG